MNNTGASSMEWVQLALQITVIVLGPLVGWLLKTVFDRLHRLEEADERLSEKVTQLAVSLPTYYVTKDETAKQLDAIFNALRRIEDQLHNKADKP